jgi:hypothetical protein
LFYLFVLFDEALSNLYNTAQEGRMISEYLTRMGFYGSRLYSSGSEKDQIWAFVNMVMNIHIPLT